MMTSFDCSTSINIVNRQTNNIKNHTVKDLKMPQKNLNKEKPFKFNTFLTQFFFAQFPPKSK